MEPVQGMRNNFIPHFYTEQLRNCALPRSSPKKNYSLTTCQQVCHASSASCAARNGSAAAVQARLLRWTRLPRCLPRKALVSRTRSTHTEHITQRRSCKQSSCDSPRAIRKSHPNRNVSANKLLIVVRHRQRSQLAQKNCQG